VRAVAYGMGLHFENNRLKTQEGQEDFELAMAQLANVLKQNAAHDSLTALMLPECARAPAARSNASQRGGEGL